MKTYRVPVAVHLNSQVVHVEVEAESEAVAVDLAKDCIHIGEFDYTIEKNVSIDWLDPSNSQRATNKKLSQLVSSCEGRGSFKDYLIKPIILP